MDKNNYISQRYISVTSIIDYDNKNVKRLADNIASYSGNTVELAKNSFEWVRDNIEHSIDSKRKEVACTASEVLHVGHGFCYAKSHLLAALLRANGIYAGFCYQRLADAENGYCLHGFNGIFLPGIGWYRVDARGNKPSVDAQFSPPQEQLAFSNHSDGEIDYSMVLAEPWPTVVKALYQANDAQVLAKQLPDKILMG